MNNNRGPGTGNNLSRAPAPCVSPRKVLSYVEVVREGKPVGATVAVIGAGGIGVDVSEFLTTEASPALDLEAWRAEWGVADPTVARGGLTIPRPEPSPRQVYLLQRKPGKIGADLGKTTGWVHRAALKSKQVEQLRDVNYERIDDEGLLSFGAQREKARVLAVDTIVICAGQEPVRDLVEALAATNRPVHLIGGADVAVELDAKRAIDQATRLALTL